MEPLNAEYVRSAEYAAAVEAWHRGDKDPLIDLVRRDQRGVLDLLREEGIQVRVDGCECVGTARCVDHFLADLERP